MEIIRKHILYIVLLLLASMAVEAQVPGTPFFWKRKALAPDLAPQFIFGKSAFPPYGPTGMGVKIRNIGQAPTSGTVSFNLAIAPSQLLDLAFDPNATSVNIKSAAGPVVNFAVENTNWTITADIIHGIFVFTSKPGVVIPVGGSATIGLNINWNLGNFGDPVDIYFSVDHAVNETNFSNNIDYLPLSFGP